MQKATRVKNPGKQRKMLFNAPAHIRHKLMSAPLSSGLASSKGARTLPVRRGDTILIKRGDNKGFEGKVSRVDLKTYRIFIEGLTREKVDGTNIFLPVHPSKVEIRNLNLDDRWRKNILERKQAVEKPAKKVEKAKKAKKAPAKTKAEVEEEKAIEEIFEEEVEPETVTEETPEPKKATAKKSGAKKAAPAKKTEKETPVEEKAPVAKKTAKPKATAKKAPAAKKTEAKETAAKPRAKRKTSGKAKGEQ